MKQIDKNALNLMLQKIEKYVRYYDNYLADDASNSFNSYYPFVECLYNMIYNSDDIDFINNVIELFNSYTVSLPVLLYTYDKIYNSDYNSTNLKQLLNVIINNNSSTATGKEILSIIKFNYYYRLDINNSFKSVSELVKEIFPKIDNMMSQSVTILDYHVNPIIVYRYDNDSEDSFKNYYDAIKAYRSISSNIQINDNSIQYTAKTNNGRALYTIINNTNNCFLMNGVNSEKYTLDNCNIFKLYIGNINDMISSLTNDNINDYLSKMITINNWSLCKTKLINTLTKICNYQIINSNIFNDGYDADSNETQFMNFNIIKTLTNEFTEYYNSNIISNDLLPCSIDENIADCFVSVVINTILDVLNNENHVDFDRENSTELYKSKNIFMDIINLQYIVSEYYREIINDKRFK